MKFYAINGSPRKNGNTAILLDSALEGVKTVNPDAWTERINLYDYIYSGCISCYACKRINGKSYGKCSKEDIITKLLEEISLADGILFGSPIYFHSITGQMRSFLERLLYPYLVYGKEYYSIAPKRMPTAFIYTMNASEKNMTEMQYPLKLSAMIQYIGTVFTEPEIMYCCDTYQFDDYSLYKADRFSEVKKAQIKKEHFPKDCKKAFSIGIRVTGANKL